MKLPKLEDLDVDGKRILVRVDLDYKDAEDGNKRQEVLLPTLDYLVDKAERIVLLGHRGRPGGRVDESLSLQTTGNRLEAYLRQKWGDERVGKLNMYVMENLRFNPGEEANDEHYARHLAEEGDIYVNEAFASSHRNHASIVSLPTFLPRAAGFHFISEVENLSRVLKSPKRPLISIISGVKEDKLGYVDDFRKFSDVILIGGRLPDLVQSSVLRQSSGLMLSKVEASKFPGLAKQSQVPAGTWRSGAGKVQSDPPASYTRKRFGRGKSQIKIAKLTADRSDIDEDSINLFEEEIAKAKTIVVSGPLGKFEDEKYRQGTERVLKAVASSNAFKVAGGGDTEKAISTFGLSDKFDWISVGGGAMLEFLVKGTLPGIKALLN